MSDNNVVVRLFTLQGSVPGMRHNRFKPWLEGDQGYTTFVRFYSDGRLEFSNPKLVDGGSMALKTAPRPHARKPGMIGGLLYWTEGMPGYSIGSIGGEYFYTPRDFEEAGGRIGDCPFWFGSSSFAQGLDFGYLADMG